MNWKINTTITKKSKLARLKQIVDQLLKSRNLSTEKEIKDFLSPPHPKNIKLSDVSLDSSNLDTASTRIFSAIANNETILIFGDYDADGISATAILWLSLNRLGANAFPFIPHRKRHGYGLSISGIKEAIQTHQPDLIITVDNGIVAHEAADFLKTQKRDLIITDHHQLPSKLPHALAIVHSDQIAGSAVAWFLSRHLLENNTKPSPNQLDPYSTLDILAIGTISDLMPMVGVNRSLAMHGLKTLSTSSRPGLIALKQEAGIQSDQQLSTYHVGFVIGPRINAMGRLEHGLDALRLLCTSNSDSANMLANKLSSTNRTRQDLTQEMVTLAESLLETQTQTSNIIIIDHQDFHEGIIGLIAGKLTEKYYKPTIVISRGEQISKASARSVSGVNITKLIRTQKSHLVNVGGHPQAAGFTIMTEQIEQFSQNLSNSSLDLISKEHLIKQLSIDALINFSDISYDLYNQIKKFSPFGISNPKPVFAATAQIVDHKLLGRNQQHLKLKLISPDTISKKDTFDAIGFNMASHYSDLSTGARLDIAFTLEENHFRGHTSLQLQIKDIKPAI